MAGVQAAGMKLAPSVASSSERSRDSAIDSFRHASSDAGHGRQPLWFTYWVLGVAGNMSFAAVLLAIYAARGPEAASWLWLVYSLSLAWFVFIFVAIWRAAGCYPGPWLWAALARAGVLVGVLRMGAEALALAGLPPPSSWP